MIKKKNYKILIGIIIGIVLSTTIVRAVSESLNAADLIYNNNSSGLNATNVQDALEELYVNANCPSGHYCEKHKTTLELGDYVYYKPVNTSYEIDTSITGYTGTATQTINPSELDLWRVFNINDDGTVELISEYVSSTAVYFRGQTGYLNLVGYLNKLAKQYETEGITSGSRHFGYNEQTEYLDPNKVVFDSAPWECSTGGSCIDPPVEEEGGGDTLYEKDYNQLITALGTRVAKKVGTETETYYWTASRNYNYGSSTYYYWSGRLVYTTGSDSITYLYRYYSSSFSSIGNSYALRPIITLNSELVFGDGIGTKDSPMEIITS